MADPTSAINMGSKPYKLNEGRYEFIIKTGEAMVLNSLVSMDISTGNIEFADDANNLVPCGMLEYPSDGLVAHLTGDGTYKAIVKGGIIQRWAVTGATAKTDIGKPVYATDGQTLTLTAPTTGLPHGFVADWISSTTCDVYLFSFSESLANLNNGLYKYEMRDLGTFPANALQGTSAATLFTFPVSYEHYKIVSFHAQCVSHDDAAVAGSQALNLDIDGTNVTGGVLTLAYTNCDAYGDMGSAINATAITAENEVHQGDVLKIEMAASGTGFTADTAAAFKLYAIIQKLPGA